MPKTLFEKGQSGNPAGRPDGSPNKKYEALQACRNQNCDPFDVLVQIAAGVLTNQKGKPERIGARLRMEAAAELAQYLAPKLKSVELNTGDDKVLNFYFNTKPLKEKDNEKKSDEK